MAKTMASEAKALVNARDERQADKLARLLAERYGVSWGRLLPAEREQWRKQCKDLLTYVDGTAFRGFLPGVPDAV